jgi:hypothetical protein
MPARLRTGEADKAPADPNSIAKMGWNGWVVARADWILSTR